VLALATLVARAPTDMGKPLPSSLPSLELVVTPGIGSRCLVLQGPGQATAAIDLEARLAETGLASVQTTDYRNLAHGRHYGLSKTASDQVVIALIAPPYVELAQATLRLLPSSVNVIRVSSDLPWPASTLDLLYHLSALGHMRRGPLTPVSRKLQELGIPAARSLRDLYRNELERWTADVAKMPIGAVVVDYDGTVCTTAERFDLPAMPVRDEFIRLLEAGVIIAFASGRGRSLHGDLRRWIPKDWWQTIRLGPYNGALEIRLSDPEPVRGQVSGELLELVERLRGSPWLMQ